MIKNRLHRNHSMSWRTQDRRDDWGQRTNVKSPNNFCWARLGFKTFCLRSLANWALSTARPLYLWAFHFCWRPWENLISNVSGLCFRFTQNWTYVTWLRLQTSFTFQTGASQEEKSAAVTRTLFAPSDAWVCQ